MRKIFSLIMVALFVTAMAVGGVWASEIDIDAQAGPMIFNPDTAGMTSGAVTIDNLWTSGGILDNVDLGDSSTWPNTLAGGRERAIGYYSSVALKTNSTLKFTFTNGAVKPDATLFLLAWDTGIGGWVTVATLNDFHTDANGNYDWIRMQVSTISAGATFTDKTGAPLGASVLNTMPADAVMVLSKEDATTGYDGVEIVANTTAAVTVKVDEAKDDNANPLTAPLTANEDILVSIVGVAAKIQHDPGLVDGPATSTIDVDAAAGSRLNFLTESRTGVFTGGDTNLTTSEAGIVVSNTAEFGLTLNAGDLYTLTVGRDDTSGVDAVGGLQYDGNNMTAGVNEWTYDTNFGAIDCSAGAEDILITANGNDVLNAGMWKVSLTIDPDKDANEPRDLPVITLLDAADGFDWSINGWQAVYPYFNADKSVTTYGSYIVINNESSTDGKVFFDIISTSDATMRPNLAANYSNKQVTGKETLAAGESQIYLMDELIDAFGLAGSTAKRNALRITVTAPSAGITATAFMDDPGSGGKRTMPLLTDYSAGDYKQN